MLSREILVVSFERLFKEKMFFGVKGAVVSLSYCPYSL
jgi:hypothetical protein